MKHFARIFLWFCLLLASPPAVRAYFQDAAQGVRPAGMGEAFVALADDANAVLFNPAGFARIPDWEFTGMYADLYSQMNARAYTGELDRTGYHFLAVGLPLGSSVGSFGAAWNNLSTLFYQEHVFTLAYARRVWRPYALDVGLNAKALGWQVAMNDFTRDPAYFPYAAHSKWGLTFDLGAIATVIENFNLGVCIENLLPADMGLTTTEYLPTLYRLGAAYEIRFNHPIIDNLQSLVEFTARDNSYTFKAGLESWLAKKTFALRLGVNTDQVTTGLSYCYGWPGKALVLQLDYAFSYPFQVAGTWGSNRLGLTLHWEKAPWPAPEPAPIPAAEPSLADMLQDPDYHVFKEFMAFKAYKKLAGSQAGAIAAKPAGLEAAKAPAQAQEIKTIEYQEDRLIFGVENQVLTDLRSIQDALQLADQWKGYLEEKAGIRLELQRFNSRTELVRDLELGRVDVIVANTATLRNAEPGGYRPLLAISQEGSGGARWALLTRQDSGIEKVQQLYKHRLGYAETNDWPDLKKYFSRQFPEFLRPDYFSQVASYPNVRACLLALQLKSVDAVVVSEFTLSPGQKDLHTMAKDFKLLAVSETASEFTPVYIRTSLSEAKLKKIMKLYAYCLRMRHDKQGREILNQTGFGSLQPISKQQPGF